MSLMLKAHNFRKLFDFNNDTKTYNIVQLNDIMHFLYVCNAGMHKHASHLTIFLSR